MMCEIYMLLWQSCMLLLHAWGACRLACAVSVCATRCYLLLMLLLWCDPYVILDVDGAAHAASLLQRLFHICSACAPPCSAVTCCGIPHPTSHALITHVHGRRVCRNEAYVGEVARADLTLRFFEFLDIQCPNNNIHNIRVCRALTDAGAVSTRHLSELNVPGKVCIHLLRMQSVRSDARSCLRPWTSILSLACEIDCAHEPACVLPAVAPPRSCSEAGPGDTTSVTLFGPQHHYSSKT